MRADKFMQPYMDIEVISKSDSGTLLTPDQLEEGRRRVAAGEDIEVVSADLAALELSLSWDGEDDPVAEFRELGGPGSGNFGHAGRPGSVGGSSNGPSGDRSTHVWSRSIDPKDRDEHYRKIGRVITELAEMHGEDWLSHFVQLERSGALEHVIRAAGGPGSGNFGHAGRPGSIGGSASKSASGPTFSQTDVEREVNRQESFAGMQQNPLAHPAFIIGGSNDPAVTRYVAAYGQEFKAQARPANVDKGNDKECYKNASLLVLEREDLDYAEGFGTVGSLPGLTFQHAWAVDKAGNVIDPTWSDPEKSTYFGVRYDRASYLKYLYKAKMYGVLGSTRQNAQKAVETGGNGMRALGGPGSGNFGHAGRPGAVGGSAPASNWIGRPASDYPPSRHDGLDTRERFSDGKGNYTPERAALHEEIIAKYMAGTTAVENPNATILGGAPGVGKSTIVNKHQIGVENTVHINPDDIRNDLPEYAPNAQGHRPASVTFTHEEASDISAKMIRRAAEADRNLVLDGTGDSSIEKLGGKVAVLRSRGAKITAAYVTTTVEEAQRRADSRAANRNSSSFGRQVPPTAMREMHKAVSKVFPEAVRQGLFDEANLFDSTGREPVLVASGKGKTLTIHDQKLWDAFVAKGQ